MFDRDIAHPSPPAQKHFGKRVVGAGSRNRTRDLLITNQLLYQLSYAGVAAHFLTNQKHVAGCWRRSPCAGTRERQFTGVRESCA